MRTMEGAWLTLFVAILAFGSFGLCGFGGDGTGGQHTWPFTGGSATSNDAGNFIFEMVLSRFSEIT
jgi:hypothetical protein